MPEDTALPPRPNALHNHNRRWQQSQINPVHQSNRRPAQTRQRCSRRWQKAKFHSSTKLPRSPNGWIAVARGSGGKTQSRNCWLVDPMKNVRSCGERMPCRQAQPAYRKRFCSCRCSVAQSMYGRLSSLIESANEECEDRPEKSDGSQEPEAIKKG